MDLPAETGDKSAVVPRTEWRAILRDAAIEVLSMMAGITVTAPQDGNYPVLANVTGVIGIGGAIRAIFSLRCSALSATKIASQMLGVAVADAENQKYDAIGEICNIVAGHFKAKIGLGDKCMLSIPTVVSGGDYRIHSLMADERLEIPLLYEGEPVWIALEIRK